MLYLDLTSDTPARGWAVLTTAPHVGWHIADVYPTRRAALAEARKLRRDGFHDGVLVRRADFAAPCLAWEKD